ncbi:TetR family transcriptional regulator [Coralloluteibacterium thermophilus]|uniref:TetR family transcriptional regulator n=1 Tax=Coralloluteibacterium thermophilum TaxID=2707049 RepID=A0ABV9NF25_9GAMM
MAPSSTTRTRAAARDAADAPPTRDERKQLTRAHLLGAALRLMEDGRAFSSLSLREVAREAGVVPAAFYRHFRDMEDLGLALVEQGGVTLRRLLREARRDGIPPLDMLRGSVLIYHRFLHANRQQFAFIAGERSGGSRAIRNAIRTEEGHFANEMAQDMRRLGLFAHLSMPALQMVCGLVVTTMLNAAIDILDLPPGQPKAEAELVDNFVRQLRVILLGARAWRERTPV